LILVNKQSLSVLKEKRENQESIPVSLDSLGLELVQEKLDHSQTKQLVSALGQQSVRDKLKMRQMEQSVTTLGQELVEAKLEIANLKGGNA
jgi:hypothetical protein